MRRIGVVDFGKRAKAIAGDGLRLGFKKSAGSQFVLINAEMRERKRAEKPAPDCSLMIGSVAIARATGVVRYITWLSRA